MTDITISDYTEKSFAVRGQTKEYSRFLADLGGKWNPNLKDGAGWIFSIKKREQVEKLLKSHSKNQSNDENENETDKLDKILSMLNQINKKLDLR
jgi:hypothetical protein